MLAALFDLVLPIDCAGCARPGQRWCTACAGVFGPPRPVSRPGRLAIPCWALGSYAGPLRQAVIASKERGRRDWAQPAGSALAQGLRTLAWSGAIDAGHAPVLVPAPARSRASRQRGGDPMARIARAAARQLPGCTVAAPLRVRAGVRDSVGLSAARRQANLAGQLTVRAFAPGPGPVVLVDDIITTGATAAESVRALAGAGTEVAAVLVLAAA